MSTFSRLIAACALLASCTPIVDQRGHSEEQVDFTQIIEGQSSQEDVQALLGSPSAKSTFGEPTWYYISEKKETRGMLAPEVIDQNVTAVLFDDAGIVKGIEKTGMKKSRKVEYVEATTPTEGRKMGVMEQLLGNFGKFNTPGREIDPRNLGR